MSKCAICLHDLPIFEGLDGEDFANVCLTAAKQKLGKAGVRQPIDKQKAGSRIGHGIQGIRF